MKNSIIKVVLLYVIGFTVTAAIYYSTDNHYAHGPNLYHITYVLTVLIGIIWFIVAGIRYLTYRDKDLLGYVYTNATLIIAAVIYVWILINLPAEEYIGPLPEPHEYENYVQSGDSTLVYNFNYKLIYLKVGDSVHLDKRGQ